jgi:hypothetical protein
LPGALWQLKGLEAVDRYRTRQRRIHPDFNRFPLGVAEANSAMGNGPVADRWVQRRKRAVVEVGSRLFDVPQRGHLKNYFVDLRVGQLVASWIGLDGPRFDDTELLAHGAADMRTVVASLAASCGKRVQPRFVGVRK